VIVNLSEEDIATAHLAREIGMDVLSPSARTAESDRSVPDHVRAVLRSSGLTSLGSFSVDEPPTPTWTAVTAAENLAYGDPGLALTGLWSESFAAVASHHATPDQRRRWLPASVAPLATVALYEGFGRSPREYRTFIRVSPDGSVQVSGRKVAVPLAGAAESILVVGTDVETSRLRAVVLGADTPGLRVQADTGNTALGAAALARVDIDVDVTGEHLLGGIDTDLTALERSVNRLRLLVAAAEIGTSQRAIDYGAKYATERIAFGRPIAGFQGVSFRLAEAQIRVDAARLEMLDAADLLDRGGADKADAAVTKAVNYAGEVAMQSTRDAVQVLGGHGFVTDHPVELWYRCAVALAVLDTDPLCSSFEAAL
jgi:alkylation response protein AidB-like acyl-CoA dehydrogenase